jgi:ubiquinone biosynthesis monooxygenase Coq6
MAWLTENANLQRALMRNLQRSGAVDVISPARVEAITTSDGARPVLRLSNGRELRTKLLVGADGFNSPVRTYGKIDTMGWAYDTHAVVATLDVAPTIDNVTAFQRFLPTGPVAFLPVRVVARQTHDAAERLAQLSETVASLVWSTKPAIAKALKGLKPETLAAFVNAAFALPYASLSHLHTLLLEDASDATLLDELAWRSSRAVLNPDDMVQAGLPPQVLGIQPGTTASFPLRMAHADRYVTTDRVALLGDAAHSVHPLAGQGLNLGLGDVAALTAAIDAAVADGLDIGALTSLQPYARARWFPNHSILAAVDKLHKLYSIEAAPVVWARSVGLETVNELGILKSAIMGRAGAAGASASASHGAVGGGGPEAASRTFWGVAARGMELAQTAASVARPLAASVAFQMAARMRK